MAFKATKKSLRLISAFRIFIMISYFLFDSILCLSLSLVLTLFLIPGLRLFCNSSLHFLHPPCSRNLIMAFSSIGLARCSGRCFGSYLFGPICSGLPSKLSLFAGCQTCLSRFYGRGWMTACIAWLNLGKFLKVSNSLALAT